MMGRSEMTLKRLAIISIREFEKALEGVLAIPNGLAIPNTPPFMIDIDSMAFWHLSMLPLHERYTKILPGKDARSLYKTIENFRCVSYKISAFR